MYTRIFGEHQQEKCCHALENEPIGVTPLLLLSKRIQQLLDTYPEKCQLYIPFFKGEMVPYNVELQDKKGTQVICLRVA